MERIFLLYVVICDSDGSSKCDNITPNYPCTSSQPTLSVALGNESQVEISQGCNISG
jgi:hypothetical protein